MRPLHVVVVAAVALAGGFLLSPLTSAGTRSAPPVAAAEVSAPPPTGADEQVRLAIREELAHARRELAATSAHELPASGAPTRAADDAAKPAPAVPPEIETKRAAAYVAVNELFTDSLSTRKWRREDELEWRRAAIDLSPEQYAELRYKLINAINANELDASDLDGMR